MYTFQLNTKDPVVTLDIPSFKDIPYIQNMDEDTKALPAEKVHEEDKLESKTLGAENMHEEDKDCTFALDRYSI